MAPAYTRLGTWSDLYHGSSDDFGVDVTNALAVGETASSAAVALYSSAGAVQTGAVTGITVVSPLVTFRITAPATPGSYYALVAVTYSDSRVITYIGSLPVK